MRLHGQGGEVGESIVSDRQSTLKNLIESCDPENINFFVNEIEYLRHCSGIRIPPRRGKRQPKQRVTVIVAGSMAGQKCLFTLLENEKPRLFKNAGTLPIKYFNKKNAWMNVEIFERILRSVDKEIRLQKRKFLLFLDNCSAHPQHIIEIRQH